MFGKNKEKYDLVFSIGAACNCTESLRSAKLQVAAYPFDWLSGSTFNKRIKILLSGFKGYMQKENLKLFVTSQHQTRDKYYDQSQDLYFVHDFLRNSDFETEYPIIFAKHTRRINRLLSQMDQAKRILIVYMEPPDFQEKLTDNQILLDVYNDIKQVYKDTYVKLLYFSSDSHNENLAEHFITENVVLIKKAPKDTVDTKKLAKYLKKYYLDIPISQYIKRRLFKFSHYFIPSSKLRKRFRHE